MSAAQIARELDGYDAWQSILNDNDATCSQATRNELYRRMYPILLAAAKNGNEMAASCYASGPYTQPGGDEKDNRADLTAWAGNALDLMRAGVRRGDWAMVDLLSVFRSTYPEARNDLRFKVASAAVPERSTDGLPICRAVGVGGTIFRRRMGSIPRKTHAL